MLALWRISRSVVASHFKILDERIGYRGSADTTFSKDIAVSS